QRLRVVVARGRPGLTGRGRPPAPSSTAQLGESTVRSSTRRSILWALALVVALVAVGMAFVQSDDESDEVAPPPSPSPRLPEDLADGCGDEASTDPTDLGLDRTLARCGPGAPTARPLPRRADVRVAVTARSESAAPLLLADAL